MLYYFSNVGFVTFFIDLSVSKKDWLKKYETLTDMVVPESSR